MAAANKRWRRELLTYFCFILPYAFLPIGFFYAVRAVLGYPHTWQALVADGGILTISIGLNADAMSRLYGSDPKWVELKIILAAFAGLAMACGSFFYGLRIVHGAVNSIVFVGLSLLVFIVSVVIATICRLLPEHNQ